MNQFSKLYMRPTVSDQGTVPSTGIMLKSPDILISGDSPICDYKNSLITPDSYARDFKATTLVYNKDNYIYVRGKNGNESVNASANVTLYYTDINTNINTIMCPSTWHKIGTDQGPDQKGQIVNVKPNEIGVVERPFVWRCVAPPKGFYSLIAQFNDDHNSNPFPDVNTFFGMEERVKTNLQWGSVEAVAADPSQENNVVFSYQTYLEVPADIEETESRHILGLKPSDDLKDCQISFMCSQPDSKGKKINMEITTVERGGEMLRCSCTLKPGFNGMISVYLYNPHKIRIQPGASLAFLSYRVSDIGELKARNKLDLYDRKLIAASVNK